MNRQKYILRTLIVTALGVLTVATGKVFAQGMGSGGSMMGGSSMMMRAHGGVSWPDTLEVVTVSGIASLGESYIHDRYTLDVDADGSADYQLSFGPWWYAPEGSATRPADGASVTIRGGVYPANDGLPLLITFEIDDSPWRDQEELLPWSGGWMHGNAATTFFHAPLDSLSWMGFPAGAMDNLRDRMAGMMGSGVAPDSAYFHFETVDPDSMLGLMGMPGLMGSTMMAGYHLGFSDPWGNDLMGDEMEIGFSHDIEMHLHYDDGIEMGDLSGHELVLMTLNRDLEWVEAPEATVDTVENTVSSTSRQVSAYYALFARRLSPTAVEETAQSRTPADFTLFPNHPNPFNASTTITYNLPQEGWVTLEIITPLGQSIRTLIDGPRRAGYAAVHWDGRDDAGQDLASGVYLYRLKSGGRVETRKLLLLQ